jgi:very-short-patch-repair endonuclease
MTVRDEHVVGSFASSKTSQVKVRKITIPLNEQVASPSLDWKTRFRIIASKASLRNRDPTFYSTTELPIRKGLLNLGLKEGVDFIHEYRVLGYKGERKQNVYFWLDFYIPSLKLAIEADGEIWHRFFHTAKRDRKRDGLLRRKHGIKVVRMNSFDVRAIRIGSNIRRAIFKRRLELVLSSPYGSTGKVSEHNRIFLLF